MLNIVLKVVAIGALFLGASAKSLQPRSATDYQGQYVVKVVGADTAAKVETLQSNINELFLKNYQGGMTALVTADQITKLKSLGFGVDVVVDDVAKHLAGLMANEDGQEFRSANSSDPDAYFKRFTNYMGIYAYLDSLAATPLSNCVNSSWLVKKVIGKTLEKRPMWAFEIGNPKAEYCIYLEGGIHAAEWAGIWATHYVLKNWIEKFASGKELGLFEKFKFVFVPLLNVDGFRWSYLQNRLWRKNRRVPTNSTCHGVDLNRNYNGFNGWKAGADECSSNYGGPAPYSEPETQVMVKYQASLKKKHMMVAMFDLHTYAQYILYPYGYDFNLPDAPNKKQLVECGKAMSAAMGKVDGHKYIVKNAADWYPGYGCADDYWYNKVASGPWANNTGLVYTIEMRPAENDPIGFVLPAKQILPASKELLAGYKAAVDYVVKALE